MGHKNICSIKIKCNLKKKKIDLSKTNFNFPEKNPLCNYRHYLDSDDDNDAEDPLQHRQQEPGLNRLTCNLVDNGAADWTC